MAYTAEKLREMLEEALHPTFLSLGDESAAHAGHYSAPLAPLSHVTISIWVPGWEELSLVERHRQVYAVIQPALDAGLHAVRIETKPPR